MNNSEPNVCPFCNQLPTSYSYDKKRAYCSRCFYSWEIVEEWGVDGKNRVSTK